MYSFQLHLNDLILLLRLIRFYSYIKFINLKNDTKKVASNKIIHIFHLIAHNLGESFQIYQAIH